MPFIPKCSWSFAPRGLTCLVCLPCVGAAKLSREPRQSRFVWGCGSGSGHGLLAAALLW